MPTLTTSRASLATTDERPPSSSPADAATSTVTHILGHFASTGPTWHLPLVISVDGLPIGRQDMGCATGPFSMLREVSTGSYLLKTERRRGYGVAARAAVLGLAFALGAERATTGWLAGNEASATISARLGYEVVGERWVVHHGARAVEVRAQVSAEDFARAWTAPVQVRGLDDDVRFALDCPATP